MKPIAFHTASTTPERMILGFHGHHVDFDWRPYIERSPEARADYDRLIVSIFHHGQKRPLITYYDQQQDFDHVLIGMRRAEILTRFRKQRIHVVRIAENPTHWTRDDIPRLDKLKETIGEVSY